MSPLPAFTLLNIPAEGECLVPGVTPSPPSPRGLASVDTEGRLEEDPTQGTGGAGHALADLSSDLSFDLNSDLSSDLSSATN